MENKKTYLYLKCLEVSSEKDQGKLAFFYKQKLKDNSFKVPEVTRIFKINDIPFLVTKEIELYTEKAFDTLSKMSISEESKEKLKAFGLWLMKRDV